MFYAVRQLYRSFFFFFFFFSSRRRHTRSKRDWSSDVCSSDLCQFVHSSLMQDDLSGWSGCPQALTSSGPPLLRLRLKQRSEERRVGKECRSRWGRDQ